MLLETVQPNSERAFHVNMPGTIRLVNSGGGGVVYYAAANTVSSASNDGNIAAGAEASLTGPLYLRSASTSTVYVFDKPVDYSFEDVAATTLTVETLTVGTTLAIPSGSITAAEIATDAVDTAEIKADAVAAAEIAANAIANAELGDDSVKKAELDYEVATVTVLATATTGTATVTAAGEIIGYFPTTNQDQFVDSIALSGTTLTVTLAAAATADNVFKVLLLKA